MKTRLWLRSVDAWVCVLSALVLAILLFWRFQLGLIRYFDIDEFAHLHWAYNFFSGMHPYRDYLYFFPPGFLFLLWPLFAVMGKTYAILTIARIFAFGWFVLLLFVLFLLIKQVRSVGTALFTLVILAWLPLPADKFLELRPDTPAMVFSLLGMYFLVKWLRWSNGHMAKWLFLSGLSYGLGLMILPKVALFAVAAITILLLPTVSSKSLRSPTELRKIGTFFIGLSVPALMVLLFFFWSGDFARAVYLTTIFANESTKVLGSKFYMFPSHFFYPNDIYYGLGGINTVLTSNHIVYVVGLLGGVISMASLLFRSRVKENLSNLLLSGSLLINLYAFMRIVPLKHAQYLILLAPFVAFYSAEAIGKLLLPTSTSGESLYAGHPRGVWGWRRSPTFLGFVLLLLLGGWLIYTNWQMYTVKRQWTNAQTFTELESVTRTIPVDAYVWDLFGQTIFYKDPYYICCIPYGQYQEAFGFVPPSLSVALEQTGTRYIFAHNTGRLSVLPGTDGSYISEHFQPIVEDPLILERK